MLSKEQLEKIHTQANAMYTPDTCYCRNPRRKMNPDDLRILRRMAVEFMIRKTEESTNRHMEESASKD